MAEEEGELKEEEKAEDLPDASCDCFCMGMGPQVTRALRSGSEQAREHFRVARLEILRGMRALIDERIEKLSKNPEKGTKVSVE